LTSLKHLNADFKDLLLSFCSAHVEFVIVGAYALAFHGLPRATGDIDILVRPTKDNAARVRQALMAFGAPLDEAGVREEDFAVSDMVYQIGVPPRRIDVLTTISGVSFDEAWVSKERSELEGFPVYFIGRQALIDNKRAAGRIKDLADVESLEQGKPTLP
jgi:hypothetical protein